MSINKAIISGNLTRDSELRTTQTGLSVLRFSVAVNDRRKVDREWKDVANFIDCVMFGVRAENISRYLMKGTRVVVEGRLHWSQWEDRNTGQKRSKIEVYVDDIDFMTSSRGGGYVPAPQEVPAQMPAQQPSAVQAPVPTHYDAPAAPNTYQDIPAAPSVDAYDDEDIPF